MVYKSSAIAVGGGSAGTGGGTISSITSTGGTITVGNPTGPTTNVDANVATSSVAGIVKPDNSTITISGGVITAVTGGGGSVTNVSGVTANGLFFSIANPTTTPAITGGTTITGILQGSGTAISAVPNGGIANALLANSAITVGAGTGLTGGGSVALGGAVTLSLTSSSVTVSGVSGITGGGAVALGSSITLGMANSIANTLAGYNSSGVFSDVSIGSNLSLSGGVLNGTVGPAPVSSVFTRTGAVTAQWNDYNFNLIGGTASASQGGTGLQTLTAHAVMLGEGVSAVSFATTGTAARILIDQGNADPAFKVISGDISAVSTGAVTVLAVHGVTYPASPSTNTVPVVTSSNVVTYEQVPNAALANSAITIGAQTGLAGGGSVALGSAITLSMGTSVANTLAGYNNSGVFSDVTIGTNLSLSGGVLNATSGGVGAASALTDSITQTSHGFSVGNILKYTGTAYALAQADSAADAEVVGIVSSISGANGFILSTSGYITGLSAVSAGNVYFLSPSSAGALSATDPAVANVAGQISKPLLIADTATSGYFNNWRGEVVGSVLPNNQKLRSVSVGFDGGGSALTSGKITYLATVPYAGAITAWDLVADQSGSVAIDVWKSNAAVPTVSNTIVGSSFPSLGSAQSAFAGSISGWTSAVSAGDVFAFKLNSASTITSCNLTILITAT